MLERPLKRLTLGKAFLRKLFCASSVNLVKHADQEKFMNRALVPITAALFMSLTWAQSQTSSTSHSGSIGGVQTFRGSIIDARCVPSDRSDSASAAITAPSGFSTTGPDEYPGQSIFDISIPPVRRSDGELRSVQTEIEGLTGFTNGTERSAGYGREQ